jgi:hypothetical protein
MSNHPTVTLQRYGEPVEIDEGMVPLIKQLWARGIDTGGCCEGPTGEQGGAWLSILNIEDAVLLLDALGVEADDDPDSLFQRIGDGYLGGTFPPAWRCWRWHVLPWPPDDEMGWSFGVELHFPREDIPTLVERLTATE